MRCKLSTAVAGVFLAWMCVLQCPVVQAAGPATESAYHRKFQALDAGDVDGHLQLAIWCRDQQAYDLLLAECNHILSIDPKNRQAQLLAKLAAARLPAGGGTTPPPSSAAPAGAKGKPRGAAGKIRALTDDEIQLLRRTELKLNRRERVKVEFKNDVLDRFWAYLSGRESLSRADQIAFNRMDSAQQAQTIFKTVRGYQRSTLNEDEFDDEFSADVVIVDDPMVFDAYRLHVWPVVKTGCATSGCHGGIDAPVVRLFNERVMTDKEHYANFLMLNDLAANGEWVINRDAPNRSLLITYLIPQPAEAALQHPGNIKTPIRTPRDRRYQQLMTWINLLEVPQPMYGLSATDLEK